jgi:hypothetical protein
VLKTVKYYYNQPKENTMREHSKILAQAQQVSTLLTDYKRYNKANTELKRLYQGRGSLTLELLEIPNDQVERALDRTEQELHSVIMMLDDHLERPTS